MTKLCTVEEVRAAEERAAKAGLSERELIRAAAESFARLVQDERWGDTGNAVFLIGPGNNGGDGLVVASILATEGWTCQAWTFHRDTAGDLPTDESADRIETLTSKELPQAIAAADLVVDAVFGVGGRADLPDEVAEVFKLAQQARIDRGTPLWAVDVPSGVDSDTGDASINAFNADVTVSFGLPKIGLYKAPALRHAGTIKVTDIGVSAPVASKTDVTLIDGVAVRRLMPRRRQDTHKHQVGWLMVVGGAPNYFGAPRMAAEAAARAGAGLVCLAVPRSLVAPISSAVREVTFLPLPEAEFGGAGERMASLVHETLPNYAAMLVGPGLGLDDPVPEFLAGLFGMRSSAKSIGFSAPTTAAGDSERFSGKAVVDADGLNWLAKQDGWETSLKGTELVLTPHPGELSRLTGKSVDEITADPWKAAREAAERFGQVVVLKHAHPVVAAPGQPLAIGPNSEPALASAGTGDVLAGTIAGLLAQGLSARDAAMAGVYIGALASERAVAGMGTLSLVAGDVIETLPWAVRSLYDRSW